MNYFEIYNKIGLKYEKRIVSEKSFFGRNNVVEKYILLDDTNLDFDTKPLYFEVNTPSRKGTIGKLIGIANYSRNIDERILRSYCNVILGFDDRDNKPSFSSWQVTYLPFYSGPTKYVYNTTQKEKALARRNKYGQELDEGELVVGFSINQKLVIGTVSRWTEHNVWIKPYANLAKGAKSSSKKDIQLKNFKECVVLDKENNEDDLLYLALST